MKGWAAIMLEKLKRHFSLTNIIKFIGVLIVLLFLGGMLAGFINIHQAKKEKNDMAGINTLLKQQGLSEQSKKSTTKFMKDYPGTKNIIVCDDKGNIVFKANDQFVQGKNTFDISKDDKEPGMFRMKRGSERFMPVPKRELFSLIPPRDLISKGSDIRDSIENSDGMYKGMKQNAYFMNSFNVPEKGIKIYYLSGHFHENNMIDMFFISHEILRMLILLFWVLLAVWVYKDSKERGLQQIFWGLLTLFMGFLGLVIYLLVRHRLRFCNDCKIRIEKDANYCQECGSILRTKCPACEKMMELEWNHCTNCGKKREEE